MKGRLFSNIEIKDILISFLVLGVVFSYPEFISNPSILFTYLIVIGIAFLGHELSHKFTAIRLGYWSEYRMWKQGILIALLFSFATNGAFVFAAPGAVLFAKRSASQRPRKADIGKIGIAGPAFNAIVFIVSAILFYSTGLSIFLSMMIVNAFLGIFNMLPFGPLDGKKVIGWNKTYWMAMFAFLAISLTISFI